MNTPEHISETSKHRERLMPFLPKRNLLDIGYGGDPVTPWAVCCDMAGGSYTNVGSAPQQLGFDCRDLPFKNETLDGIFSSHVIEDFTYAEQAQILREWIRVLARGGVIVLLQPDQKRFEAHCRATGQGLNLAHKEPDYSLATFREKVWPRVWGGMVMVECGDLEDYSFYVVMRKQ